MRTALAAALVLFLGACERQAVADDRAIGTARADPACTPVMFEQSPLTHCVAVPDDHRVRLVTGSKNAVPYRALGALAADRPGDAPAVAFAMNGGMFDADGAPIGYYVSDGRQRAELNLNEGPGNFHLLPNGVFHGSNGRWAVTEAGDFAARDLKPDFATQSGPMLVIDGELHPAFDADGASLKIRNGVGIDDGGRAHFVISEAPISFGRFARYFRDVLGTPNALFLDGSVSSLWDPARGRIDARAPLGPLIVVEKKAKAAQETEKP